MMRKFACPSMARSCRAILPYARLLAEVFKVPVDFERG